MVFERPKRPGQNKSSSATQRPSSPMARPGQGGNSSGRSAGGGRGSSGGGGPVGETPPSPWLGHPADPLPAPDASASFVEYLRWMRSPDHAQKDPTKVQIFQMAQEGGDYRQRLSENNRRTKLIAGKDNSFEVKCPWRIRVGGHRGPESVLLPAFDAMGMPYIPSSTLRGVARAEAIRSTMAEKNLIWKDAEKDISQYFGSLDADKANQAGKIVFLDAYPVPGASGASGASGGLEMDMANSIWSWDSAGKSLNYSPNPNPFFSLRESTFLIGLKPSSHCQAKDQASEVLQKVQGWLIAGLSAGVGSQVNTGYGSLLRPGKSDLANQLFDVEFSLDGQLIHGNQQFTQWYWKDCRHEWQMRGKPNPEVRSVAFKSMLRYWFRAFGLGVLPPAQVKAMEAKLFGAINPQTRGLATFQILNGRSDQEEARPSKAGQNDPCGQQSGYLVICRSSEAAAIQSDVLASLFESLTWMMFHLGGVGQGARRPCYSRRSRKQAPWWRGSTLIPESDHQRWALPESASEFQTKFQRYLQQFYTALGRVAEQEVNYRQPLTFGHTTRADWEEVVDSACKIVICSGEGEFGKPYALAVLHGSSLKVKDRKGQLDYDPNLCGRVQGGVKPSPVWISNLDDYQVVTVFGANQNPRNTYLKRLRDYAREYEQIWPFT